MGIELTKQELQQYRSLRQEIDIIKAQLDGLEVQHDCVKGSNTEFPYESRTVHIYGRNSDHMEKLYAKLEEQLEKRILLRIKIEDFIDSIDDAQVRTIFRLRHVDNRSWLDISMRLGATYPEYAQIKHDRFLKEQEFQEC